MTLRRQHFESLSIKDLLLARDIYHYHLMNKANVVGTAIGRYLIRDTDLWPKDLGSDRHAQVSGKKGVRTFNNSHVRSYSWPCVLVLVDTWLNEDTFNSAGQAHPTDMVPSALFLEDGRSVPVCVVKVEEVPCNDTAAISQMQWPDHIIGGGYPLIIESQGESHVASVGCLVTDGHTKFALTNRHVAGKPGDIIQTLWHGRPTRIGVTSRHQLTHLPFTEVYPEFVSRKTYANLDIGLIEIDDARVWTSEIADIGPIGDMEDINVSTLSLDLIDQPVEAFGSASGKLSGKIKALFYRYKTTAGYDYVTDLLIAPDGPRQTIAGDSGTIWVIPPDPKDSTTTLPRPFAVQWGAQSFSDGDNRNQYHFALASSLNNICRLLNVDLLQAHNVGAGVTWGSTGHYTIGAYACDLLGNADLKKLMIANKERISFDNEAGGLNPKDISQKLRDAKKNGEFVPLADVPDIIWKNNPKDVKGGRDTVHGGHGWTGPEHPNHFADIDEVLPDDGNPGAGKSMIQLSTNPAWMDVDKWLDYFTRLEHTKGGDQGLLPFRVWQIYKEMVTFLDQKDIPSFLTAAGILSHYVGDACQPLHSSMYSDGYSDPEHTTTTTNTHVRGRHAGEDFQKKSWPGQGVHGTYEDGMVDKYSSELYDAVVKLGKPAKLSTVTGGQAAGQLVVDLMRNAQKKLPPKKIIDAYIDAGGKKNNTTYKALYDACGKLTAELWLMGASTLAALWESAWNEGNGSKLPKSGIREYQPDELMELYQDPGFLKSYYLADIKEAL
jgi:hypothetical protein